MLKYWHGIAFEKMWPDKFVYATYEDRILFGYDVRLFWNCDPKIKNQAAAFRRKLLDNYFQSKGNVAILYWDRFIYKPILIAFFRKNTAKVFLPAFFHPPSSCQQTCRFEDSLWLIITFLWIASILKLPLFFIKCKHAAEGVMIIKFVKLWKRGFSVKPCFTWMQPQKIHDLIAHTSSYRVIVASSASF